MGYEARQEAMNDFIAERAHEMMPDESEYTMDEDIPKCIAEGTFDDAVKKRFKALYDEASAEERSALAKYLMEGLE